MKNANWLQALQIGFTYIGTIVGAGFASGQEIMQFFTIHGMYALLGIFLATCLFGWGGFRLLRFGYNMRSVPNHKLTEYVFGKHFGLLLDSILLIMLFGVTSAMLAGVGALFDESLHVNGQIGTLITIALTLLVLSFGMNGILSANSLIVPCMFGFTILIFLKTVFSGTPIVLWNQTSTLDWNWLLSSISYTAMNLGLAVSVLIPLGAQTQQKRTLVYGSIIGAVGLGLMMLVIHISIAARIPNILLFEVPMGTIASTMHPWIRFCFTFVLWGEIFSTLIGNVYGLSHQLSNRPQSSQPLLLSGCILILSYFVSHIGFSNLVTYVYPLFGYLSFLVIAMMLLPEWVRKRF
jgi:uncharacterized membrane protein YkvI